MDIWCRDCWFQEKATASSYANAHGHELDPTWELEAEFLPIESLHTFGHGADTDDLRVYSSDDDASVDAKDVHSRHDDELWDVEDVETRGPLVNMETFRCLVHYQTFKLLCSL